MRTEDTRRCCALVEPPDVLEPDPPLALDVPVVPLPVVPLPVVPLPVVPLPEVVLPEPLPLIEPLPLAIVPVISTLCPTCFFSSESWPSST